MIGLIDGPTRTGRILGAFGQALILAVDTPSGPRVVSLLGRAASGVPNGVRLAAEGFAVVPEAAPVLVGGGHIRVGDLLLRVVRSWESRVRPVLVDPAGLAVVEDAARLAEIGVPSAAVDRLAAALRSEPPPLVGSVRPGLEASSELVSSPGWDCAETMSEARSLLGLGTGLTPGGDDVLAGLLIGWHAAGRPELARSFGDVLLAEADRRTSTYSGDLLRLATRGHACLELLAVANSLAFTNTPAQAPGEPPAGPAGHRPDTRLRSALRRLLSVGHTSGADLTTGLALGLRYAVRTEDAATGRPVAQEVGCP